MTETWVTESSLTERVFIGRVGLREQSRPVFHGQVELELGWRAQEKEGHSPGP